MRIGIDYTAAVRQGGGIGRYTRGLVQALSEIDCEDRYVLFVAAGGITLDRLPELPANFHLRAVPISDRWMHIWWQRLRLPVPVQAVTGPLDLFHSPDFVLPPAGRTVTLVTVHDLSFRRVPQFFVPGFCSYLDGAVTRAVRRASHVLADSECTRRDLVELMRVERKDVTVAYPGVDVGFQPVRDAKSLERVQAKYRLPRRFVLGLSTIQPRKNFDGLIKAFAKLAAARHNAGDSDRLHLVIAGEEGWLCSGYDDLAEAEGVHHLVHFPGFVEDADLPALYSLADVFAFPSWYEGFGLPALEAMACGTPVVAADNSSLPEVIGDAGLLVDAADTGELALAILRALDDAELRERLIQAGLVRARHFSWRGTAEKVLQLYQNLVGGK